MSFKLSQIANVTQAFQTQNINANSLVSTWYAMSNYDRVMFAVDLGNTNSGAAIIAVEARQATSAAGTTNKQVTSVTNASLTTANSLAYIEIRATDLDTSNTTPYYFVAVKATESNSKICTISGVAIRTPARWPQDTPLP